MIAFVLHVFAFGFDCLVLVFVAVVAFVLHVFAFEFAWFSFVVAYFSCLFPYFFSLFSWFDPIIHRRCCMVDLSSATTGSTTF